MTICASIYCAISFLSQVISIVSLFFVVILVKYFAPFFSTDIEYKLSKAIVKKLNEDGKGDKPACHTFLDDIVGAIAAAASTRAAQIISEDNARNIKE